MSYDHYDESLDDDAPRRRAGSPRKQKPRRPTQREDLAEPGAAAQPGAALATTYRPSRYEEGWLLSSLGGFFEEQLISDVLAHVKGGKEATVYCCEAHPTSGGGLLAAKVYRPRMFRSLRNDALYREGRGLLIAQGRALLGDQGRQAAKPDGRMGRALAKKTAFGKSVLHTSWVSYEFSFMEKLFRAGADVPRPVAVGENAILMSYCGDEGGPAPALSGVRLERAEARELLGRVLRNVELMLEHGFVHGDLSAYNILYWEGRPTIIDFPQVADLTGNAAAFDILSRDVARVCEYFARQGAPSDPGAIARDLWARYAGP